MHREEIQGIQGGGGDKGLMEQTLEISGRFPVRAGELAEGMMIPNTVDGSEVGRHRAKILCFLLGQEPLGGGFHGPVAETVDRPFVADAEHGERVALVLLVLELHFLIGDQVFLRGGEGERVAFLIGGGGHGLLFLGSFGDFNFIGAG